MKSEQLYNDWKNQRSQTGVEHDLTEEVMKRVYQYEQKRKFSLFDIQWLIEAIAAHPVVQAGMIVFGAIVGFIRLVIILHALLYI